MVCKHLQTLEAELIAGRIKETFRGKGWSVGCREWVYFDCYMDLKRLRKRLGLAECVHDHEHLGTHDGQEAGFVCIECQDAIMGVHRQFARGLPSIR